MINAIIEEIEAERGGAGSMSSQNKEAADYKLNIFWREVVLSDDAPVTQHFPTPEEISAGLTKSTSRDEAAPGLTSEIDSRPSAICDR